MPKRVTRRRHGGRDHNFPGRGAARSGAERSAAVGARPCQRGAGGLHGATGSTELPSSPSDVFTALRLHLPVRIMAYIYFSPSVFFFFPSFLITIFIIVFLGSIWKTFISEAPAAFLPAARWERGAESLRARSADLRRLNNRKEKQSEKKIVKKKKKQTRP